MWCGVEYRKIFTRCCVVLTADLIFRRSDPDWIWHCCGESKLQVLTSLPHFTPYLTLHDHAVYLNLAIKHTSSRAAFLVVKAKTIALQDYLPQSFSCSIHPYKHLPLCVARLEMHQLHPLYENIYYIVKQVR